MAAYLSRRLVQSAFLYVAVTVATFVLVHLAPGGPAVLADPNITKAQIASGRHSLALDQPLYVQYGTWVSRLLHGDLGISFSQSQPVLDLIRERLPNTLVLGVAALAIALVVGVGLGVASAVYRNTWVDTVATTVALFNLSVPAFWLGIVLIIVVAVDLQLLPASGMHTVGRSDLPDLLPHLLLPAVVASSFLLANVARYTRAGLIEALDQPFILVAQAKGLSQRRVIWLHALKHAMLPIVTVVGLSMPQLFGGAAITETVFGWPGLGRLGIEAAVTADYPVVMGVTLVVSAIVIVANLLTDVSYTLLDPRVRLG